MNDNSINDSSSSINDDNGERSMFGQGIRNFLNCGACINDSIQECKVMQECAASLSETIMSEKDQFESIRRYITRIYSANNQLFKFLVGNDNMYDTFENSQRNGNKLFKINDSDTKEQKECKENLNAVFNKKIGMGKKIGEMWDVIETYQNQIYEKMSKKEQFAVIQYDIDMIAGVNGLQFLLGENNMYDTFENSQANGNKLFKINDSDDTKEQKECKENLNKLFNEEIRVDTKLKKMLEVIGNYQISINNSRNNNHAHYNNRNLNNNTLCNIF